MPRRTWPWLVLPLRAAGFIPAVRRAAGFIPAVFLLASCMDVKKEPPLERTPSLYTRLGGAPAIGPPVDDFVAVLITAGKLKPAYQERGLPEVTRDLKQKLVAEVGAATGGPEVVTGKPVKEAYPDLKVTSVEFDGLIDSLATEKDRKELRDRLAGLRDQLVSQP